VILSPVGVLSAVRFLAAYSTATRLLGKPASAQGGSRCLLQTARKDGLISVIAGLVNPPVRWSVISFLPFIFSFASICLSYTQHLEACNMWALITQSSGKHSTADPEGLTAHGSLVGRTVEACAVILRNIVLVTVAVDGAAKEDSQAALESLYKSHTISRLVDACKQYGTSLSPRCVALLVCTMSELALSSSKFLAQVTLH
jgi:hypothetical protein